MIMAIMSLSETNYPTGLVMPISCAIVFRPFLEFSARSMNRQLSSE